MAKLPDFGLREVEISEVLPVEISTDKIRMEMKFYWKKLSHLDPPLMFLSKIRYPPYLPLLDAASLNS